MRMFVANCTPQLQVFQYRVPEIAGNRTQEIPPGSQIALTGDLNQLQIDSIVQQHSRYGLTASDEVDRTRPYIGLCYSIDKPVNVNRLGQIVQHNRSILDERGREIRKEAAVAINEQINTSMSEAVQSPGEALNKLEVSVQEEKEGTGESHKPINEGVRVTTREDYAAPPPKRGKRR